MKRILCSALVTLLLAGCGTQKDAPDASSPDEPSLAVESREVSAESSESYTETATSAEAEAAESVPAGPTILTITVPEGYPLAKVGMLLEENGLCTAEEFIAAAQEGDFSDYPLVAAQEQNPNRCYKLEGYLFPDTHEVYSTDTPDTILRKMLDHTEQVITADLRSRIKESGYTIDEILTMASIIQKEAFGPAPMPDISSVLHNRLEEGMMLQCDVTITYVEGAIKPFIQGDENRYNDYYNTYKCPALPAGAICNPGLDAIEAALSPAESDNFFFVTDADKNYYYAATWEEHLKNVEAAGIS